MTSESTLRPQPAALMEIARAPIKQTNNQIKASAIATGVALKRRWKVLLPEAMLVWKNIPSEDLLSAGGNVHKLAGLIQLRYRVSRSDSDTQVRDFFAKHAVSV